MEVNSELSGTCYSNIKPKRKAFTFQYTKNTPNQSIEVKSKLSLRHLLQQHEIEEKLPAERTSTTNTSEWKKTRYVAAPADTATNTKQNQHNVYQRMEGNSKFIAVPADTATNTKEKVCNMYQWMEGNPKFIAVPADTATNTKEKVCVHQHNELTGKRRTAPASLNGWRQTHWDTSTPTLISTDCGIIVTLSLQARPFKGNNLIPL